MVRMGSDGRPVFGCLHAEGHGLPRLGDTLSGPPTLEER